MDLDKYMCFILLTTVCYIDAIYILTENNYTWSEATEACTLATPNLNFTANGTTPDLDNLPIVDAWLGYTEKMTPFEYFDCVKASDLDLTTTADYTTEGDPGKCWSACNGVEFEAVAVYANKCYCLQSVIVQGNKVLNNKCNKGCPSQPNIACGGVTNNSMHEYVSLYKTTYTEPTKASELENSICLWYEKSPASSMWGKCTLSYRIICYNGNRTWVYNGSIAYGNWITMTTQCFNNGGIPSNYNNTKDFNTSETGQMWTGIIRNGVIYQVTDHTNVTEGKYGYVNITTGQLLFTSDNAVRKRALCVEGTTGTTDENTAGKGEMLKNGSSDVGAIVGATVAIIIVVIVVIVLVVLWKRGIKFPLKKARKLEKEKKQATNMTYSFARPDNTIQGADETSFTNYADVDVSKMTLGGQVKQNGDTNRTSCSSDEPHTYFVLEKVDQGPYDKTKTTSPIHDQHTFNPYNKISIEESSNYDHIGAHVNDSKKLGLDNPYNTTTLTSSNKYNGFTNNAFNRNYESDDTYNHIDGQSCHTERNHSGNPYNTTAIGHSKNDGVTNIAFNINGERDDTYNHIGD